jgi:hypothetical protein
LTQNRIWQHVKRMKFFAASDRENSFKEKLPFNL